MVGASNLPLEAGFLDLLVKERREADVEVFKNVGAVGGSVCAVSLTKLNGVIAARQIEERQNIPIVDEFGNNSLNWL